MTIQEMKRRKMELGYSNAKLSEISGVPVGTIQKIFSGETSFPRYDTVMALTMALSGERDEVEESSPYMVQKRIQAAKRAGDKTIDDYINLPEGTRVELLDGKFYDLAAPNTIHQQLAGKIFTRLSNFVEKNKGKCIPFVAPTDVQLDQDNKTMLQPDVLVVCDRSKITRARVVGAPDFIVEIVSPSNVAYDAMIKMLKYKKAGVKEYWLVFPDELSISVYDFTKSSDPVNYTFEDKIPVGIWDGKCEVDFKEIFENIKFMYE